MLHSLIPISADVQTSQKCAITASLHFSEILAAFKHQGPYRTEIQHCITNSNEEFSLTLLFIEHWSDTGPNLSSAAMNVHKESTAFGYLLENGGRNKTVNPHATKNICSWGQSLLSASQSSLQTHRRSTGSVNQMYVQIILRADKKHPVDIPSQPFQLSMNKVKSTTPLHKLIKELTKAHLTTCKQAYQQKRQSNTPKVQYCIHLRSDTAPGTSCKQNSKNRNKHTEQTLCHRHIGKILHTIHHLQQIP